MKTKEILILKDYRNHLYFSIKHKEAGININKFADYLKDLGYRVEIKDFSEINFTNDYQNYIVIYQSSEDRNLFYKSYIDDIIYGLSLSGAILIPGYELFKAHHNKVFMEIYREIKMRDTDLLNIHSRYYGTYEEFKNDKDIDKSKEYILKPSAGARSDKVSKVNNKTFQKEIKKLSRTFHPRDYITNIIKGYLKKTYPNYNKKSNYRKKYILQDYIQGLTEDYKVLIYFDKYYILKRKNRKNSFTASGSGLFEFPDNIPRDLLNYSEKIFSYFDTPFASFDIGQKNGDFHLFEFQFIHFGTYTLEKSNHYYVKNNEEWGKINIKSDLEYETARSIHKYIKSKKLDEIDY